MNGMNALRSALVAALGDARHLVLVLPVVVMHATRLLQEWAGWERAVAVRVVAAASMAFGLTVLRRDFTHEFIYFQF